MKLYLGEYSHALDERNRLTLPRKMRFEINEKEVVLARGFDTCIFGFDKSRWEKEAERNLETSITDHKSRGLRRYLFAAAEKVEIDKLGRILLPQQLREYAKIVKNVKVLGAGDHFEIWDTERWVEYSRHLDDYEQVS